MADNIELESCAGKMVASVAVLPESVEFTFTDGSTAVVVSNEASGLSVGMILAGPRMVFYGEHEEGMQFVGLSPSVVESKGKPFFS